MEDYDLLSTAKDKLEGIEKEVSELIHANLSLKQTFDKLLHIKELSESAKHRIKLFTEGE